ncbi:MAG: response regulator [Lachnospiraceae bacterium]|nr:response regulator [Lachnospiraceae bacterium]
MEHLTYEGNNQKKIERFLLLIYSIYNLNVIVIAVKEEWDSWVGLFLVVMLAACWIVSISKWKNYEFRAKFAAIMMQGSMVLYAIHLKDVSAVIPVFLAFAVFMGLYGIPEITYYSVIAGVFIYFYHGVIIGSIPYNTMSEAMTALAQLGNVLLLEYVVYIWTKRNSEGSRQLLDAIEELKIVENSKDEFLANVSHEIRTPINTICGMSELVLREELPVKTKENILNIQIAGRNLMSVVSDILDFSELQSGKIELEEEAYNITSTINDVINMTLARKNEKKIELIVDCDANIPCALLGDEKKLRRVIMNLVDNAIKFTEDGCVTIVVGFRRESYGINLVITVKDTGIGMAEESVEKLFAGFSQVDTSSNRMEGGVGLGLAISQALVKKMGGAITVRSKLGKGSIVKFVVPQKVLDEAPIASIQQKDNINVATYIDMEQFDMLAIRDEYSSMILHMVEQLKGKCHICRNLAELQRRQEKEHFSHVFISIVEYRENTAYFDKLAQKTNVIIVLERAEEKTITNPQLLKIYKPFYILTIVSVLNGLNDEQGGRYIANTEKFVTRDAHVLVVDDNRMNIRVIEGLLANYNIKVSIATSGQMALEKITSADYDFVFMDHMMPEMDGVETFHRIRHKVGTYYQKVPIIALTANAVAGTREMLLKEGFDDFLEKPVERSVLERVLKRNLPADKIIFKERNNAPVDNKIEPVVPEQIVEDIQEEKNIDKEPNIEKELAAEGLDVQKGILYCNGKEQYIKVLQGYCEDCDDSGILAEQLFLKEDWKNYVIAVHGMKSAMRSIGAIGISEIARKLEVAGREERIDYIREHHQELLEEYKALFERLRRKEWICPQKESETNSDTECNLPVLESKNFDQIIERMEDAMYSLDEECLLAILTELENYQYYGVALNTVCTPVRRKVEMSDYVSAVEMVVRFKNGLDGKEVRA